MNDAFGREVATLLDEGLDRVDETVATRLQIARKAALAHAAAARNVSAMEMAAAGPAGHGHGGVRQWLSGPRLWLAVGVLAIAVSGVSYFGADTEGDAAADLDLAILADDLPVAAYIDDGFDKWLNRPVEPSQ